MARTVAAAWPASTDVVVGEVVTGGAGASDEWVELYGRGPFAADLGALELLYITATGGTVTRKATFAGRTLAPGQRLLLANAAGAWAGLADATWTGGLAATGGTIALRVIGGSVVDSLSWGTAANPFVEGAPGAAPPAGSSLERLSDGPGGNGRDTNDNAADAWVQPMPLPEGATSGPAPTPAPTPTPTEPPVDPTLPPPPDPTPALTAPPADPTLPPPPDPTPDLTAPPADPTPPPVDPTDPPADPTAPPPPDPSPAPTAPPADPTAPPPPDPTPVVTAAPTADPATPPPADPPAATATPGTSPAPTATPAPTSPPDPSPTPAGSLPPEASSAPTTVPATPPIPDVSPLPATPIATARGLAIDSAVTVEGVLTTPLGLTESGKGAFLQDATAGIALYLTAADWAALPAGTRVRVTGTIQERYGQRTIRLPGAAALLDLGPAALPDALDVAADASLEPVEGSLARSTGTISGAPDSLSDGYAIDLARPGGSVLRVVVAGAAGIEPASLAAGRAVVLTGVLGQRDASGAGSGGYRLHLRSVDDVAGMPAATPTPTPVGASPSALPVDPTPTPAPTTAPATPTPAPPTATPAAPTPAPTPTPTPTPSPATPTPAPTSTPAPVIDPIGTVRTRAVGSRAVIEGTVTAEPGRLLDARVVVIQDATGGIPVRLPAGVGLGTIARGRVLRVSGVLAAPYAAQELRPASASDVEVRGDTAVPAPVDLTGTQLSEATEGRLARIAGSIRDVDAASSGSITVTVVDETGPLKVFLHPGGGVNRAALRTGLRLVATGIVGQRESAAGRGDGHRLWPRDATDLVLTDPGLTTPTPGPGATPAPTPRATATPRPRATGTPQPRVVGIRDLVAGQTAGIDGWVTTLAGLLDGDARRIVVQDATGAILVRLPDGAPSPRLGSRLRATGEVGTYYGAPQLAVDTPISVHGRKAVAPLFLRHAPDAKLEWRLVRVVVRITDVSRDGDAWRIEGSLGAAGALPIAGVAAAGISSDGLVEGRMATVTGIVRRAWPTASDQRFTIVPRSPDDLRLGPEPAAGSSDDAAATDGETGSRSAATDGEDGTGTEGSAEGLGNAEAGTTGSDGALVARLADLPDLVGRRVRVGGQVAAVTGDTLTIRDGEVTGRVRLLDGPLAMEEPLTTGEVVNVTGTVTAADPGWELVTTGTDLVRAARLAAPADPAAGTPADAIDAAGAEALPAPGEPPAGPGPAWALGAILVLAAIIIGSGAAMAWLVRRRRAEDVP